MRRATVLVCALLASLTNATGQTLPNNAGIPVEVVATASEYVPRSTTIHNPGRSYSNCVGNTSYFGQFYGNSLAGNASTNTTCSTTSYPATDATFTTYRRVNYTLFRSERALYMVSCTQKWRWSKCPAFLIGTRLLLGIDKGNAMLGDDIGSKPIKLTFVGSAALPASGNNTVQPPAEKESPAWALVHITSSPDGAEIYIDGRFVGDAPSDFRLAPGDHSVRVALGAKEWSRSVRITPGEINIHAKLPPDE